MDGSSVGAAYSSGQSRVTLAALEGGVTHSIPDRPDAGAARPAGVNVDWVCGTRSITHGGRYFSAAVRACAPAATDSPSARATAVAAARVLFDRLISSTSS